MNRISPDEVLTTPAGELAALGSESLFQLKNDAADLLAAAAHGQPAGIADRSAHF